MKRYRVVVHDEKPVTLDKPDSQEAAKEAASIYDILNKEELSVMGMKRIAVVTGPDGEVEQFRVSARTEYLAEKIQ